MLYSFINSPTIRVRFRDRAIIESESCQFLLIERSRKVSLWRILRGCKLSIWISQTLVFPRTPIYVPPTSRFGISGHARYREAVKHASHTINSVAPRRTSRARNSLSARKIQQSGSGPDPLATRAAHVERARYRWSATAVSSLNGMKPTNQESSGFLEHLEEKLY